MKRLAITFVVGAALPGLPMLASAQQAAAVFTSATRYNVAGQVTGTLAPDPDGSGPLGYLATRNTYGASGASAGLLTTVEVGQLSTWADETIKPANWSGFTIFQTRAFEYDNQGRKIAERMKGKNGATESLVQYSYDSWDRVDCKVVRMNPATFASPNPDACALDSAGSYGQDRVTKYTYDGWDQVTVERRGLGTPVSQYYVSRLYEARGKLRYQSDAKGNKSELRYDSNGRLWKRLYPSPTNPTIPSEIDYNEYTYDKNGNVEVERKRSGATITNTYDANNRLTFKDLSNNTYSGDISYGYDLRGLMRYSCFGTAATNACDTSGEGESNSFDNFGNLISRKSRFAGTTRELVYQYDLEGNRRRITHPDGIYFTYGRDGLNRVCSIGEWTTEPDCNTADSNAFLVVHYSTERGRADITRPGGFTTNYATDNALRIGTFTHNLFGTANDLNNSFQYNPASQITSLTQNNNLYNYTEAQNRSGVYDANGLNQYTVIDGGALQYDTNGNLIADGAGMTYTYDIENRLVATGGTKSSTLRYDPLGRLSQYVVDGITRQFHYDGDALVGQYYNSAFDYRYVHGDGVDEPLVQYTGPYVGPNHRRYIHTDHLGSVVALSDNSGVATQINSYDAYGIPKSTNNTWIGYTGQLWLAQIGLNYYKARIYTPKLGRFLQTDPIFYSDDMNLYAYVGSDPIGRVDSSGAEGVVPRRLDGKPELTEEENRKVGRTLLAWGGLVVGAVALPTAAARLFGAAASGAADAGAVGTVGAAGGTAAAMSNTNPVSATVNAASARAASASANGARGGSANAMTTAEGQTFTGASGNAGGPGRATNPQVQQVLDSVPVSVRPAYHGCCGEVNTLSNILNAGANPQGALSASVQVAQPTALMTPCPSCAILLRAFRVNAIVP